MNSLNKAGWSIWSRVTGTRVDERAITLSKSSLSVPEVGQFLEGTGSRFGDGDLHGEAGSEAGREADGDGGDGQRRLTAT